MSEGAEGHARHRRIRLVPRTPNGAHRIERARLRLRQWDRVTWRVTMQQPTVSFSDRRGPWALVEPATDESTGWLNHWISLSDDPDFTVLEDA